MRRRRAARRLAEQASQAQAQAAAYDGARALAVELGRGVPSSGFDAMTAGLVLHPGEIAYRSVRVWIMVQQTEGWWAPPSWVQILVTDQHLLCQYSDGLLPSIYWIDVAGLQIGLEQQHIVFNFGDLPPLALAGAEVGVIAVAAVAALYGPGSLLSHPGLSSLRRCPAASDRPSCN